MKDSDVARMLEWVNDTARGLSKWEEDFMESITEQYGQSGKLSEKQKEVLERIYAHKTP